MQHGDRKLPARFWAKVMPEPTSGCWLWVGAVTSRGYGSFNLGMRAGRQVTGVAHKLTWRAAGRPLPRFKRVRTVLDHRCRTRCCVNPDHLDAVAEPINVARGVSPSARHARKTHCPAGHAYTPANTYVYRKKRYCRACRRKELADG